ncbi:MULTISPECIES: DUF3438 family protein [Vibrio]|uniref:DUF3438 family protein n=1 Tax=Vibrio TaxID=662 RepID=UPI001E2C8A99|nr:DUF3438 family protein [Vibrio lentus]MCC4837971.1 TIGR03749 family integrating conjugative element protein [Vibrio lentus]
MVSFFRVTLALAFLSLSCLANAIEVKVFEKEPISIVLEVGKQRIIELEEHASVKVHKSLSGKIKIDPANGSLYITTLEEFDKTPARIVLKNSNVQIRVNLSSVAPSSMPVEHMRIEVYKRGGEASAPSDSTITSQQQVPDFMKSSPVTNVGLLRFAAQLYWLPERLKPQLPSGVSPVRLQKKLDLSTLMTHCSLNVYDFSVIEGFKTRDGRYLTTIKVVNTKDDTRYLNLTHWNMEAELISPRHLYLGPSGTAADITTVAVITTLPFAQAINEKPHAFAEYGMDEGCI